MGRWPGPVQVAVSIVDIFRIPDGILMEISTALGQMAWRRFPPGSWLRPGKIIDRNRRFGIGRHVFEGNRGNDSRHVVQGLIVFGLDVACRSDSGVAGAPVGIGAILPMGYRTPMAILSVIARWSLFMEFPPEKRFAARTLSRFIRAWC